MINFSQLDDILVIGIVVDPNIFVPDILTRVILLDISFAL